MIVIASPTRESFYSGFTYDLFNLVKESPDTQFMVSEGTWLVSQRTDLVRGFLQTDATHILFIDSDMRFPPDTLKVLLDAEKDIISVNCIQRKTPLPTAFKDGQLIDPVQAVKQSLRDKVINGHIQEVDSVGFGIILISRKVFEAIQGVWFATPFDGQQFVGEDRYFCHVAKEAGFKVWTEHRLALKTGHCGIFENRYQYSELEI